MSSSVLKRVTRRETHSPRTVWAVIVLIVVAAAAVYAGIEIVLHLLGLAPLLVAPGPTLLWLRELPSLEPQASVVAGSAAVGVVGLVLLWLAVAPGRRSKHRLDVSSHAVVADNGVIASAVAERLRREIDLPRDGVVVGVGHRSADVTVRPEPGREVDRDEIRSAAEAELASYRTTPTIRVHVRVQPRGTDGGDL
ncbi:MAG: DUF6286 domain-containing protein [Microbacterium sp.]